MWLIMCPASKPRDFKSIVILIIVCLTLSTSCDRYYKNYRITDVELRNIIVADSLKHDKDYFLLKFTYELCNPEIRFFSGGGVEPGLHGIYSTIDSLRIFDKTNKNITSLFKGWGDSYHRTISNGVDSFNLFSTPSITSFINSINAHDTQTRGTKIGGHRLYYIIHNPANEITPQKVHFQEKQINIIEDVKSVYKIKVIGDS